MVKIAQTYRTGTNDIDALDYVEMILGLQDLLGLVFRDWSQTDPFAGLAIDAIEGPVTEPSADEAISFFHAIGMQSQSWTPGSP